MADIVPSGTTEEDVRQLYNKYQQMESQGVSKTDPELIKARSILQSVQQRVENIKTQQAQRQIRILEQQNKKRLLLARMEQDMARMEQDNMSRPPDLTRATDASAPNQVNAQAGNSNQHQDRLQQGMHPQGVQLPQSLQTQQILLMQQWEHQERGNPRLAQRSSPPEALEQPLNPEFFQTRFNEQRMLQQQQQQAALENQQQQEGTNNTG